MVFLEGADISHVDSEYVYYISNLYTIKERNTNIHLSVGKMEYCYNKLMELKNNNQVSKEEHINNIHAMRYKVQSGICPRCNSNLVLRTGKNGQFYGCSNYPNCTFTKNVDL